MKHRTAYRPRALTLLLLAALACCPAPPVRAQTASPAVPPSPTAPLTLPPSPTLRAPTLTHVAQVRGLSPEQAARGIPVVIRGVVTVLSGFKNSFFFHDGQFGISVDRTDTTLVHVGDQVEVTGVSSPGLFAPIILASQVRVLGQAPLPVAHHFLYNDLVGGTQDSQWIELQGVVHSARMGELFNHPILMLRVEVGGNNVTVYFQDYAGLDFQHLVDATVRLRGVPSTFFNVKRQFVGVCLFVPRRQDFYLLQPAAPDPYAAPATHISNVMQFGEAVHRVKVAGIVTYQIPGRALYLQEGADGIRVKTDSPQLVPLGTRVEAVGFPFAGDYSPALADGAFRIVGTAPPIVPVPITAAAVIGDSDFNRVAHDQQLVQLQGTVVENHREEDRRLLLLRDGAQSFEAILPNPGPHSPVDNIAVGSVLSLTGICTVQADADRNPSAFRILLRSADDVTVLHKASWWTVDHALIVLAALAGLTLIVALWGVVLRSRVERQTRIIRESEARFRDLAQIDTLTGLPNRLMLEDRIAESLARSRTGNLKAAVLTMDIDRFKQLNDTYGHPVGDEILKVVAQRLRSRVRQVDTISRTGGEEFTQVIGCLPDAESAARVASNILDLFLEPVVLPGLEIKISLSIGGALFPDDGTDSETLRKRSDQALYEAKRLGRNRAIFVNPELSRSYELSTSIERELRRCLASDLFVLHFQPIFDAAGAVRRLEALLRTDDPWLTGIGPARFVPVAEESGLIIPLGRWVVEQACRQIAAWQTSSLDTCPIAINVSWRELLQKGFAEHVLETLARLQVPEGMLEIELTETTLMTNLAQVEEVLARLARAGCNFAIDDFGTGYSSLARLHGLPIRTLKIDRSFIQDVERNSRSYSVVCAIIQMARSMHLEVVAEGIETGAQFDMLRNLGCDLFQGYLLLPPAPAEDLLATLHDTTLKLPA